MKEQQRELRQRQTKAEAALWAVLRNRRLGGMKFRRQHDIGKQFIADFYCAERQLIVEVDGGIHQEPEQQRRDEQRTSWMQANGLTVVRFTNEEVLTQIDVVCAAIILAAATSRLPREKTPLPPINETGAGCEVRLYNYLPPTTSDQ